MANNSQRRFEVNSISGIRYGEPSHLKSQTIKRESMLFNEKIYDDLKRAGVGLDWECTFCGAEAKIHSTAIVDGVHFYFCNACYQQWLGFKPVTNEAVKVLIEYKTGGKNVLDKEDKPISGRRTWRFKDPDKVSGKRTKNVEGRARRSKAKKAA